MAWSNLFDKNGLEETLDRVAALSPKSSPKWGKMNVSQMLAHCNVAFEMTYTDKHPKPKGIQKFLIKLIAKKAVVGPKPLKKNGRTAPVFLISDEREFQTERERLVDFLKKTYDLGPSHFEGMDSHSFGPLTSEEWNTLFSKHLDHHLTQFGV